MDATSTQRLIQKRIWQKWEQDQIWEGKGKGSDLKRKKTLEREFKEIEQKGAKESDVT